MLLTLTIMSLVSPVAANRKQTPIRQQATLYEVTFEIDKVHVIEDRDFGSGEIYLKVIINNSETHYSDIWSNVNDGDTIPFSFYVFSDDTLYSFDIRIEVWESDDGYNEAQNDFLGHVELSRDPPQTNSGQWYDAQDPVGGNNQLQAQLYIIESANEVVTTSESTTTTTAASGESSTTTATEDSGNDGGTGESPAPAASVSSPLDVIFIMFSIVIMGTWSVYRKHFYKHHEK